MIVGSASASTLAHYTFDEGTAGAFVFPAGGASAVVPGGGDGTNNLIAWSNDNSPTYVTSTAPTAGPPGRALSFSAAEGTANDDLYLQSTATASLATNAITSFTVEAFVNFYSLAGWQTFVGRDDTAGSAPGEGTGSASLFYLAKSGNNNGFRVELITATNTNIQINSTTIPVIGTWYHVAAVGDAVAGTLKLYVNGAEVGSIGGFTGLFDPAGNTTWTLGRGQFGGNAGDQLRGQLDEVRFSDVALTPAQFLYVPEPSVALLGGLGVLGLLRRRR